ncbi:MAG: hypothetical protein Q8M81_12505 [Sediminibacterium sp.]|nr:hypothetical protein [Sediminibacterium sp.]
MQEADRERLEEKKKQAQAQQEVMAQSQQLASWWLPILDLVLQQQYPWQLAYFTCATGYAFTHWEKQLQSDPWVGVAGDRLVIKEQSSLYVHDGVTEHFPGHHPLRYEPKLPFTPGLSNASDPEILTAAFQQLGLTDGEVYFFCMRLSPVLLLRFSDLVLLAGKGLLDLPEDICIAATDYSWLIFRSLEGEWQYGYQQQQTADR